MEYQQLCDCIARNLRFPTKDEVVLSMADEYVLTKDKIQHSNYGQLVWENKLRDVEFLLLNGQDVNEEMYEGRNALHFAVEGNFKDMVALLIHHGIDVNGKEINGFTPLHVACFYRYLELVELLLNKGANVHAKSMMGSPILAATFLPNPSKITDPFDVVRTLIKHGANVNDERDDRETALILAMKDNNMRLIKLLIDAKANVNVFLRLPSESRIMPLLSYAVFMGRDLAVKSMLAVEDLDIDEMKDDNYRTPLHIACARGNLEIVKLLVEKKFNINASTKQFQTPMSLAVGTGNLHVAEYLRRQESARNIQKNHVEKKMLTNVEPVCNDTLPAEQPLVGAIKAGDLKMVKELLNTGAELDKEAIIQNQTIAKTSSNDADISKRKKIHDLLKLNLEFMKNVRSNKYEEVKDNIKNGACVNVSHEKYASPLIYAAWKGFEDIVDLLLKNGADVNFKSRTGFASLHMACRYCTDSNIVKKLLHNGAYYNMRDDKNNETPLYYARVGINVESAELLANIDRMFQDVRGGKVRIRNKAVLEVMKTVKNTAGQSLTDVARVSKCQPGLLKLLKKILCENEDKLKNKTGQN